MKTWPSRAPAVEPGQKERERERERERISFPVTLPLLTFTSHIVQTFESIVSHAVCK